MSNTTPRKRRREEPAAPRSVRTSPRVLHATNLARYATAVVHQLESVAEQLTGANVDLLDKATRDGLRGTVRRLGAIESTSVARRAGAPAGPSRTQQLRLPLEIIAHIASLLPPVHMARMHATCRELAAAVALAVPMRLRALGVHMYQREERALTVWKVHTLELQLKLVPPSLE